MIKTKAKKLLSLVEQDSKFFKKVGKVGNIEVHVMELKDGSKVVELETRKDVISIDTKEFKLSDVIKALQMVK